GEHAAAAGAYRGLLLRKGGGVLGSLRPAVAARRPCWKVLLCRSQGKEADLCRTGLSNASVFTSPAFYGPL
ncbi:unnamed protein product, partial [Urochloa humidicola]